MIKKVYVFPAIYIMLVFLDGAITYFATPDLTFEGNPLITVFSLGWGSLILANLIGFAVYIFCCYYCFEKYETVVCEAKNIGEYISQITFGRTDKFSWVFYKVPKNWPPVIACLSYEVIWCFIAGRVITIFEWYLWHNDVPIKEYYVEFKETFAYGRLDIVLLIILAFILVSHWFFKEYAKSKAAYVQTEERGLCI